MAIRLLLSNFPILHQITCMTRRSGIFVFNSKVTCTRCPGSRRRFNVNMGFTDDDRILIENLYIFKGYGAKNLLKSYQVKAVRLFCIVLPCIA